MQHMLIEDIQWDCDGMKPVEDCNLPLTVLAINVPGADVFSEDEVEEYLADLLSETYGFCHGGCLIRGIKLDSPGHRMERPDAVMNAEETIK